MDELDKIKRAKMYIDKLASGKSPIDDSPVCDSDIVNNVRVSRCLFYVSDILQQVIDNKGVRRKAPTKHEKENFSVTLEQLASFPYSDEPITVSEIAKRINEVADLSEYQRKVKGVDINNVLVNIGVLEVLDRYDGKTCKLPTEAGKSIGIITQERIGKYGPYFSVLFTKEAQQFVVDNINAVVELCNTAPEKKDEPAVPWSDDERVRLVNLYGDGLSLMELSAELNRPQKQIKKELNSIGIKIYV